MKIGQKRKMINIEKKENKYINIKKKIWNKK